MAFIQVLDANGVVQNLSVSVFGGNNIPHHINTDVSDNPIAVDLRGAKYCLGVELLDAAGNQITSFPGSVTQGTSPWVVSFSAPQHVIVDSAGTTLPVNIPTATIFKTAQATASGSTAVWTPAAGKKFNVQWVRVILTENAAQAVAGVVTIDLLDAAVSTHLTFDVYVPGVALSTTPGDAYDSGWMYLGSGILSSTINNLLNVNLSSALTAGNVRVIAAGTEV